MDRRAAAGAATRAIIFHPAGILQFRAHDKVAPHAKREPTNMRRTGQADMILPKIMREAVVGLIRHEGADLTTRQFAVFLICYVEEGPHTVRLLSERTHLSKPAISRVLDRLGALGLTRRVAAPQDKRNVLIARTADGFSLLGLVREKLAEATKIAARESEPETPSDIPVQTGTN
jgi:DNA-binding MarR family transcriptional regulator